MNVSPTCAQPRLCFRTAMVLWLAVFLNRPAGAGDAGSPPTPAAGTAETTGAAAAPGRVANPEPATAAGVSDFVRFNNEASDHYYNQIRQLQPEYYFFPPDPPPLGTAIRLFYPARTGMPAPPELAAYVNEPFYPALGVRLAAEDLPRRLQQGLAAYRAARTELQNELRSKIARLSEADAAARQQELAALARVQTPRLMQLEATAAQLRIDLQRSGVYGVLAGRGDWNEGRSWHLAPKHNDSPSRDALQMEFEVMRAAVYYQDGLSPAQRRLVREIAMELQAAIRQSAEPAPAGADTSGIFFLPETARIH